LLDHGVLQARQIVYRRRAASMLTSAKFDQFDVAVTLAAALANGTSNEETNIEEPTRDERQIDQAQRCPTGEMIGIALNGLITVEHLPRQQHL
jgi:hypothetical protein